jgi:hypothetical protein
MNLSFTNYVFFLYIFNLMRNSTNIDFFKLTQELSEDSNAQLFKELSQGCFIEYNNAYLYEYIKLSGTKVQTLQ